MVRGLEFSNGRVALPVPIFPLPCAVRFGTLIKISLGFFQMPGLQYHGGNADIRSRQLPLLLCDFGIQDFFPLCQIFHTEAKRLRKLLFVLEVLPNEDDRLSAYLRECFSDRGRSGGDYEAEFAYSINETLEKLMSFKPDIVLINFDSLFQIQCGQLASRIVESPYRPKEVIAYGLNLEAEDKQSMEQLGIQYVDQRRSFAKLITTVKQTALRQGLKATEQAQVNPARTDGSSQ